MILYIDCFAGLSGDMFLAAFADLGMDMKLIADRVNSLCLNVKVSINAEPITQHGLTGKIIFIDITGEEKHHRHYDDIKSKIENSAAIPEAEKKTALAIFDTIARAEAEVHNTSTEKVHFHELGAVDSIVDIIGAAACISFFGINKIYSSSLPLNEGSINVSHGLYPLPAPATSLILKGIPVRGSGIRKELVTPTGAAIIKTLAQGFGFPEMLLKAVGCGFGSYKLDIPNCARLFLGGPSIDESSDTVAVIKTLIDDMQPMAYEPLFESLYGKGAREVFITGCIMKKSRPGSELTVICSPADADLMLDVVFRETTTTGARVEQVKRKTLERKIISIDTEYGQVQVKLAALPGGGVKIIPEYESVKKASRDSGRAFHELYEEIKIIAKNNINDNIF